MADRSKTEHDDRPEWTATGLRRVGEVVRLLRVSRKCAKVGDLRSACPKQTQNPPVGLVVADGFVPLAELLVAALALAGVVETAIVGPAIEVAMLLAAGRVSEQEHVGGGAGGFNATERRPTVSPMDLASRQRLTYSKVPRGFGSTGYDLEAKGPKLAGDGDFASTEVASLQRAKLRELVAMGSPRDSLGVVSPPAIEELVLPRASEPVGP